VVALEAFKADQADWIAENSAKQWATAYDFPAVTDKRVVKEEFPISDSGRMQGFVLNLRRDQFKDARLRRAFNYAFDFEEMNKQLFYGQYKRINSYFEGTELASSGLPEGLELEILQSVRDKVPADVFTKPYVNPVGGNPESVRANLRESARLLKEAGFEVRERKLVDASGKPVTVEILVQDPSAERIALFYKPSLERIGVTTSIRIVDDAQYQNRLRNFDFDVITDLWGQSASPGNEQRNSGDRRPPTSPARETPSASRIPRSTR
jgi:microcin C transport system substrate-binding protein